MAFLSLSRTKKTVLSTLVLGLMTTGLSSAAMVSYTGTDVGANSTDARVQSNASAASFDGAVGALGTSGLITFESAALGTFTSLAAAPGVTVMGIDSGGNNFQTLANTPFFTPDALYGYNTTAGGSKFVQLLGGSLTFSFATPVDAFGAYFTGGQLTTESLTFSDGSSQTLALTFPSTGGSMFFGFTDAGKSISSITLNADNDIIAVDDVRYVVRASAMAAAPEPAMLAPLGLAALGAFLRLRRRRS